MWRVNPFLCFTRIAMRISLITPTHNPTHLPEVYWSLLRQDIKDWEWVIVVNRDFNLPADIASDTRVRTVKDTKLRNIGALKRLACEHATGDIFVELDHDDLLVPGKSLSQIKKKFLAGAGFVFSDAAVFKFKANPVTHTPFTYSSQYGWEDYPIWVYGKKLKATRAFDITPRSLAEIYYCPDHVRAWSREAYYLAGGHNPELAVCDDHELLIKTYLTGVPFMHTGTCNYLYRLFDKNTFILKNKNIQETTQKLKKEHFAPLVNNWVCRHSLKTLDLSDLISRGWSADRHLLQGFGSANLGHITANMELQKLVGWQVREFMNEAYEALIPGGYLTITVPEATSGMGYSDVEWQSQFSSSSMTPYTQTEAAKINGKVRCKFQLINCIEFYSSDWHRDNKLKFIKFELAALKGQRFPGLKYI
jgi:glycosyltransferase involved in cell wall biosynthesis